MANQNDTSSSVAATNKRISSFLFSRDLVRPQTNRVARRSHDDSPPEAGFLRSTASGFRRVARRFPARGWVLAEQTCIARGARVWVRLTCLCRGTPRAAWSSLASPTPRDNPCWCDDSISIHSTSRASRTLTPHRLRLVVAAEDIEGSRKESLGSSSGSRRR